jgi:hypothetical protein
VQDGPPCYILNCLAAAWPLYVRVAKLTFNGVDLLGLQLHARVGLQPVGHEIRKVPHCRERLRHADKGLWFPNMQLVSGSFFLAFGPLLL